MDSLLQSQIQKSCRLALPNGLKELMNDISREVLRAQPPDLFKFITNYLSALLVTRENLYIAAQVCNAVCDSDCQPELEDELRYIGLDEQVARDACEIIEAFLGTGEVNEGNLLQKLVERTSIDESKLPAVLSATRRAFLRHQRYHTQLYDYVTPSKSESIDSNHVTRAENMEKTKVTFEAKIISSNGSKDADEQLQLETAQSKPKPIVTRLSSTSLAGSYLSLPQYRPYSAHDIETLIDFEESPEKERSNYDYTKENSPKDKQFINDIHEKEERSDRKILFIESPIEEDTDDESIKVATEEDLAEDIVEDIVEDMAEDDEDLFVEGIVEQIVMGNHECVTDKDEGFVVENIVERGLDENVWKMDVLDEAIVEDIGDYGIIEDIADDTILEEDDNFGNVTGSY